MMDRIIGTVSTVLPVFIALFLGVLCRKKNIISPDGVASMRSVAVNITLPAVVLNAFASAEYDRSSIAVPLIMFGVCCLGLVCGLLLSKILRLKGRLTPYLFTGFEAGMLGYALFTLLFHGEDLSDFAIVDLGQVLFVFTVYKALLAGRGSARTLLREAFMSPTLWAIGAGLIIGVSGAYGWLAERNAAQILDSCTDFISAPTGMLILLSIGYDLVLKDISWRRTAVQIAVRYSVMGVLLAVVLVINRFILNGVINQWALILMFLLPPPYVLPVFAGQEDERSAVSSSLSAMTAVSLILFAVMCAFV